MAKPLRFPLSSVLLLTALVAVALGWWRDHLRLRNELLILQNPSPRWDTDEVTGQPNTQGYGDIRTAWASKSPDGQKEWLILDYARIVQPKFVAIHETYNPGAVYRVTVIDGQGTEHIAWEGQDPLAPGSKGGMAKIPLETKIKTRRIKVYLDSPKVPGWNEIDAVGMIDTRGSTQWAERAFASSSYGRNNRLPIVTWLR